MKNSHPENLVLNGRAALCAGRDEMSSEDEEENEIEERGQGHRFAQPEEFDFKLQSGAIPDAAMIYAARQRRQKAREQGICSLNKYYLKWICSMISLEF